MPGFKDRMKATKEAFCCMLLCIKSEKDEDDCPGLPQPKLTNAEEVIPKTLVIESISSSTDSESGPTGADSGPRSDRVSEPQGRPSDEKRSDQQFDGDKVKSSQTEEKLHQMCRTFPKVSKEQQDKFADVTAARHLYLMLHHFMKSEDTACSYFMYAVFASRKCNLNTCLDVFMAKLNENQMDDSEELPLDQLNALRGIKTIVRDHSNLQGLKDWLHYHLVTLSNVLVNQHQPKEPGIGRKGKKYLVPGEAIDILTILLLRLDLVHTMKSDRLRR